MGLEAATLVQDLDTSNPLAGDRKNQGDDHIRLLKAVLKTSFPNLDRPFRLEEVLAKTADYVVLSTDDRKNIHVSSATGTINLTLPVLTTEDGWFVRVMKTSTDANPVFVIPPSGAINDVAKIRINVPYVAHTFVWTSARFLRVESQDTPGTLKLFAGSVAPVGFNLATGQSLLRTDHPELFVAWGTSWGAADGTHFNAPDLRDRFPVGAQNTYALGATGGEATHTLSAGEMPVHAHAFTQTPHDHGIAGGTTGSLQVGSDAIGGTSPVGTGAALDVTPANANITVDNAGGGAAHENRPPYLGLNFIYRLC